MKTFLGKLFAVLAAIYFSGCGEQSNVEKVVQDVLKDPSSAQFKDFAISKSGKSACIGVNAKNSFGGYSGWKYFELRNAVGWVILKSPQDPQLCTEKFLSLRDEFFALNEQLLTLPGIPE